MSRCIGLLLLSLVLVAPAIAQTAGGPVWTGTSWGVACRAAATTAFGDEAATQCDDANPVSVSAANRYDLEQASVWLKELGFAGPAVLKAELPGRGLSYLAFIDPSQLEPNVLALYNGATASIFLNTTSTILVGGGVDEAQAQQNLNQDRVHGMSSIHELFHGIQFQYAVSSIAPWGVSAYNGPERDWIWEGTARAIEALWARESSGGASTPLSMFHLDNPLHEPDRRELDQYNVALFWLFAGKYFGAEGRDRLRYLDAVFRQNLVPQRGVAGVDAVLAQRNTLYPGRGGLADVLPAYVAQVGHRKGHYDEVEAVTVRSGSVREERRVTRTVKPLAAEAIALTLQATGDRSIGLAIRIEDAPRPADLHLIVDTLRYDHPPLDETRRNEYLDALETGETELFVRVVNVATQAATTQAQPFTLVVETVPLEPCDGRRMAAALNDRLFMTGAQTPASYDPEGINRPGQSTLALTGLVTDQGDACTNNIAEVNIVGGMMAGDVSAGAMQQTMEARAEAMQRQMAGMNMEELAQQAENGTLSQADMRRIMRVAGQAGDMMEMPGESRTTVLHVFSPHLVPWQSGMLTHPFVTEHGGLGGWHTNSASNVMIQIPGVAPTDLRVRREPYPARAIAPHEDAMEGESPFQGGAPSLMGFYTSWDGTFRPVPYPPPKTAEEEREQAQSKATCQMIRAEMAQSHAEAARDGAMVPLDPLPMSCEHAGLAFEGEVTLLVGDLEGTVTIESITGGIVSGEYTLTGSGQRLTRTSRFVYEDGRLVGDESEEATQDGPIRVAGVFTAPACIEDGLLGPWARTVRIGNGQSGRCAPPPSEQRRPGR